MRQLSGLDAAFVYGEQAHAPTHGMSIIIYDPSTAPTGRVTFKGVLAHLEARLHLARAFRQKLVRVPGDLDHPYWVEDGDFDLEYHVRHIALPKPGDWRQLCIQVARLHSRGLDLSRPLWELYVIEGLDHVEGVPAGSFAFALKIHHAAIDGQSGAEMITALHSQEPFERDPPAPEIPWQPEPDPSPVDLLARAGVNSLRVPGRSVRTISRLAPGVGRALRVGRDGGAAGIAPFTRFNRPVSPHRVIDARFYPFADLKPMRAAVEGATVNDVALAIVGGALRAYLDEKRELPTATLRAMTPISVRTESERGDLGNQVSAMMVSLGTDVADPVGRLAAVRASSEASKALTRAVGARNLTELSQLAPGALIGLGYRLAGQLSRRGFGGLFNTVVTNVPGPRQPLYFAGARVVRMTGAGPILDGMGLINIVGSYQDQFVLSFTSCRTIMPDPARYADCVDESFGAMRAATAPRSPSRRRSSR